MYTQNNPLFFVTVLCVLGLVSFVKGVDFDDLRKSLVVIETIRDDGKATGSGFVLNMDGQKYIMTNGHVLTGAKKMLFRLADGTVLKPKKLELADSVDLARIVIDNKSTPADSLIICTNNPTINESVKIYGNSLGRGAITELKGKILGVGPDQIEVDNEFVCGNSGSPIIKEDGTVIGVATYLTSGFFGQNWTTSGTRFDKARRFGFRVSNNIKWVKVSPKTYYTQTKLLSDSLEYLINAYYLSICWQNRRMYSSAKEKMFVYANSQYSSEIKKTPWDKSIKEYVNSYIKYWGLRKKNNAYRGIKVSENSISFQLAEGKLKRDFMDMSSAPERKLDITVWATSNLRKEAEQQKENIKIVQEKVKSAIKEHSDYWDKNILD